MQQKHKTSIKTLKMDDNEKCETEIVTNYLKSKHRHILAA